MVEEEKNKEEQKEEYKKEIEEYKKILKEQEKELKEQKKELKELRIVLSKILEKILKEKEKEEEKKRKKKIIGIGVDVAGAGSVVVPSIYGYHKYIFPLVKGAMKEIDKALGVIDEISEIVEEMKGKEAILSVMKKIGEEARDSSHMYKQYAKEIRKREYLEKILRRIDRIIADIGKTVNKIKIKEKIDKPTEKVYELFGYRTSEEWKETWDTLQQYLKLQENIEKLAGKIVKKVEEGSMKSEEAQKIWENMAKDCYIISKICEEAYKTERIPKGATQKMKEMETTYTSLAKKYGIESRKPSISQYAPEAWIIGAAIVGTLTYLKIARPLTKMIKKIFKVEK